MIAVADGAPADCEWRDDWGLEQDVNAWTSLGYVAVGAVLVAEVVVRRLPRAALALAFAAVVEGAGSLLYHGATSELGQFMHDVPLVAALGFVAGWHTGRLAGFADGGSLIGFGAGSVASAGIWLWAPGATNVAVAVAVLVIVAASLVARSRRLAGVWNVPLLALGAFALATWAFGTRDSPLCEPQAWLQPHGLWHLLTAVIVLAWADAAYGAAHPDHPPRLFRRFTDRTIGLAARGLVHGFHRSVDVVDRDLLPTDRPVLIVANHGNGFVDPVVVAGVLGRLPRFLAKAALWKVVVARPFLALAGVLPVYRSADGDDASDNRGVFDACHHELAHHAVVAIFPEGTTGDRATLDRVKSGAARIALGSLPTAPDVVVAPIGMAFENTVVTRSRVVVMFGEPIDVAPFDGAGIGPDGEPAHDDARALTDRITRSLEAVSPQFASIEEREILRAAAREERADATGSATPGFGATEVVARRLAAAPADRREQVVDAYRDFATRLSLLGLRDDQLRHERLSWFRLGLSAVALALAGSLLATVTLVHLPAVAIVVVGTGLVRSTATKGTVRILLGLVTMLATWIAVGMILGDRWMAVFWGVAAAVGGAVALVVWPPLVRAARVLAGRVRVRDRVGLLEPVVESRARLVATVRDSIGADDG